MHTSVVVSLAGGIVLAWAGCGLESHQTPENDVEDSVQVQVRGLNIVEHSASSLLGRFASQHGVIDFEARAPEQERAELVFTINGKTLSYEALTSTDEHDGFYRVLGDVVLSRADSQLAREALDALIEELGDDQAAMALFEASVAKMAAFLAQHQVGQVVQSLSRSEYASPTPRRNKRLDDDATICIKKNTTVTANYDKAKSGTAYAKSVVVGSDWGTSACGSGNYACMGRCGSGCGGFGSAWTMDCLDHDACSHDLCASGGSRDVNCGDEYSHAQSEFFASCRG
jgi:hypothetical protein